MKSLGATVRKVNDRLVRWKAMLRQVKVGDNAFMAIGGIEGDALAAPVWRAVVFRFNFGIQGCPVIGIKAFVDVKNRVRNWLHLAVVGRLKRNRGGESLGQCIRVKVLDQAQAVRGRAFE